jgi:hypothetical protein
MIWCDIIWYYVIWYIYMIRYMIWYDILYMTWHDTIRYDMIWWYDIYLTTPGYSGTLHFSLTCNSRFHYLRVPTVCWGQIKCRLTLQISLVQTLPPQVVLPREFHTFNTYSHAKQRRFTLFYRADVESGYKICQHTFISIAVQLAVYNLPLSPALHTHICM